MPISTLYPRVQLLIGTEVIAFWQRSYKLINVVVIVKVLRSASLVHLEGMVDAERNSIANPENHVVHKILPCSILYSSWKYILAVCMLVVMVEVQDSRVDLISCVAWI